MKFNSHVHTMVTGGGLIGCAWRPRVYYDGDHLRNSWRKAVIGLLRAALQAKQLRIHLSTNELEGLLATQEKRTWRIKIQSFNDK